MTSLIEIYSKAMCLLFLLSQCQLLLFNILWHCEFLFYPLSKVPPSGVVVFFNPNKKSINEQRIIALKDITRLLELVTVQEENTFMRGDCRVMVIFYRRHMLEAKIFV